MEPDLRFLRAFETVGATKGRLRTAFEEIEMHENAVGPIGLSQGSELPGRRADRAEPAAPRRRRGPRRPARAATADVRAAPAPQMTTDRAAPRAPSSARLRPGAPA